MYSPRPYSPITAGLRADTPCTRDKGSSCSETPPSTSIQYYLSGTRALLILAPPCLARPAMELEGPAATGRHLGPLVYNTAIKIDLYPFASRDVKGLEHLVAVSFYI